MSNLLLLILALLPGFILLYFILYMDRNQKEPLGLVLLTMVMGALSVVPAVILELLLGAVQINFENQYANALFTAFMKVAWVEELCKLGVVLLFIWRNRHFNEENDGIVYVGASALGFAMLENVFYVFQFGMSAGFIRALTAMPLHCFTGVLMGYYTGKAKIAPKKETRRNLLLRGFFLAVLLHGLYDALLFTRTPAALLIVPLLVWLFIFGIKFLKKGRALSLARSSEAAAESGTVPSEAPTYSDAYSAAALYSSSKYQLWKIIISRTLFVLSGIFWLLTISSLFSDYKQYGVTSQDIITGAIFLSFFPILIGILLETSYHRNKKKLPELREAAAQATTLPLPPEALEELSPPGQFWRMALGRSLLILSALIWALFILAFLSGSEDPEVTWQHMLIAVLAFTFFPIFTGVLLEHSYQKRKKRFLLLLQSVPLEHITADALSLSPPASTWKIILSRFFFGFTLLFWILFLPGIFSTMKDDPSELLSTIVGAIFLTSAPLVIAVLLETSYQKKRKEMKLDIPSPESQRNPESSNDQAIHSYAQKLKTKRDIPW
jgi:RsiW-degrading membrane proteinase PrsW (M82 family)